ncbi:hypothetical protein [Streptomyces sp. NPDC046759]|uniref:hypothetical protein n=1 Tax=Streptomyces sp. NPDC046759 TaxID=3155019 RepID=UPI0033DC9938
MRIAVAGTPVGSLQAVRGPYWTSDNLRERMADEQSFPELVAAQLLDERATSLPSSKIIDNALAAPEEAAHRGRERLRSLDSHGGSPTWDDDEKDGDWDEDGDGEGARSSPRGRLRCCAGRSKSCACRRGRTSPPWVMPRCTGTKGVCWACFRR